MTNDETMNDPAEHFDDELLSAYVDGELMGEELALVEQRLADDPQAGQLVEELRALSQEVQSLPQELVGDDLRATILQRAERAMLLGAEEQPTLAPRESGSPRRWMWAAMALAAMLLLTVFLPNAQQDEKPLASAKPAPGEPKQAEPRLEAVAAEEAEASVDELVVRGGGGGGAFVDSVADGVADGITDNVDEVDAPVAVRARAAMSASAPSAAGYAAAEVMAKPIADEVQPAFQVFLTLNDSAEGIEQFNQLLVSNGIRLEETHEQEEDSDGDGLKNAAADSSDLAKGRDKTKELSEAQQSEHEEVVLVEATTEQIENLLEAYNADVKNFASVRLTTEQKTTSLPIEKWQQWERSGKQLAQNKLKKIQRAKQSARQSLFGRAMRLNANQYQTQGGNGAKGGNGVLIFDRNLLTQSPSPSKANPKSQVQVLFILQQPSKSPPGEPAVSGEDR